MALPREPRQKMINMMYLVLTALLALNVSSEILNAFKTVNSSLETSITTVNASTETIMQSLLEKTKKAETAERANIWYPKAKQVQDLTTSLNDYINSLKQKIGTAAKYNATSKNEKGIDNLDATTRIMVEKGDGKILYNRLQDFQKQVLAIDPLIASHFANSLPIDLTKPKTRNKGNNTWEAAYFRMVPTIAAMTILSKFQNDVKTSENKVISYCHELVGKVEVVFNRYEPIIGQNSKVLLAGQELEITAGLAAFNNDKRPTVTIGGAVVPLDEKGMAIKKFPVNSSGKIPVKVSFTDQAGKLQEKIVEVEYIVGQSSAAVQLDKMNVLFIGVDNPVTISGSGSVQELSASINGGGGSLSGSGAHRIARVTQETDNCVISVRTPDGKTTNVNFRVRSIPDPTPMVGTAESGDIPASMFKSQAGIRAYVKNFFYETQFNVTTFRITGDGAGFDEGVEEANNTGAAWNEAKRIRDKCRPGSYITVEDIYAIGPDGRRRKLTPLIFNLK